MNIPSKLDHEQRVTLEQSLRILQGEKFATPSGAFNANFTPRSIEVPWSASYIHKNSAILDVGLALANLDYLGVLVAAKEEQGVTVCATDIIRPERVQSRYPEEWVNTVLSIPISIGPAQTVSLPQEKFDTVLCISTLEHIGYDAPSTTLANSAFERPDSEEVAKALIRDPHTDEQVLNTFYGTLKKGGIACITVPMGEGKPIVTKDSKNLYSTEREYDEAGWKALTGDSRFELVEELFFKNTPEGWVQVSSPRDLADVTGAQNPKQGVGVAFCALKKR
jgi:hypothetical protein